ncbi:MAG: hypothetical protein LJE59_05020 [Chromatiaceae bacterium]|jgi:hypothetical protein|nr:hypothetical protein [Chromatiaceae bacterium]
MKAFSLTIPLFGLVGVAHAHVAGLPPLQHALEHGWLALVVAPLVLLALPLLRGRR